MLRQDTQGAYAVAFAFLLLLLLLQALNADKLDELIDSVESVVNRVAEEATVAFRRRFDTVAECRCSHHACGSEFASSDTCHEELGDTVTCPDCLGQKVPHLLARRKPGRATRAPGLLFCVRRCSEGVLLQILA